MSDRKRPRSGTANAKILRHLETFGTITTTQVRIFGFSGNPGQRLIELREVYGCRIASELCRSSEGKPYCRWTFDGFRDVGVAAVDMSQQGGSDPGVTSERAAGGSSSPPAEQLQLVPDRPRVGHLDHDLEDAA